MKQTGRFCITSYLQLRELDLLGRDCFGSHRLPLQQAHHPALILLFAKKFFRSALLPGSLIPAAASPSRTGGSDRGYSRMRWTGQIFWLLAYVPISVGITFSPPSPPKNFGDWPNWEVVSSYSSATAPDSHGISCADPLFQARKELDRELAACALRCNTFFAVIPAGVATNRRPSPLIEPSAASITSCSAKA